MGSGNRVPICLSGYDASDCPWVVPVSGLTGGAITSRRSHNFEEPTISVRAVSIFPGGGCFDVGLSGHHWDMTGLVRLAPRHDRPDNPRHLVGHGNAGHPHRLAGEQRDEARVGCVGLVPGAPDQRGRPHHQQLAQVSVAHLGDAAEAILASALFLRRRQTQPSGELAARAELRGIGDGCSQRRGTHRADARDRRQAARDVVAALQG